MCGGVTTNQVFPRRARRVPTSRPDIRGRETGDSVDLCNVRHAVPRYRAAATAVLDL
jgi:hypothetical protein